MRFSKALVAVSFVIGALTVSPSAQRARPERFAAGEILVKFQPGANGNDKAQGHKEAGATLLAEIARTRVVRVRVAAGAEDAAIARYRRNPNVLYAERNVVRNIPVPAAQTGSLAAVPGDYYFDEQWGLHNTGQPFQCIPWIFGELCLSSGTDDADIDAPEAWEISQSNASVTVAVIDSGVDYTNPDLASSYAGGYDFVFSDSDPMDDHGHGTHVAGTIAAALANQTGAPPAAEGVVGVAPQARIRAYKVCRSDGTCDDFAIQQAIAQAIDDGVRVINMSLGETEYSQSLDEAVQEAWNAGLVIVAGAGNNGTTDPFYPAALDNVISVAAFDENHQRASFSNYGTWVDISAPGNVIMSTYPMAACQASSTPGDTGCYTWNSGTSMATPHVAGAAALVWARSDVTSNSQVVDILLNSADRHGKGPERLDSWTIHGGLNLYNAVIYGSANLPPDAVAGPDQTVLDMNGDGSEQVSLNGNASSDQDGTITSYVWREGGTSIASGATATVTLSMGVHNLTLEVTDDDGAISTDTVVVTVDPANQVSVAASTAQATEAGPTNGVFTVTRTGDTSAPLTVQYTVAGTATAGTDYTPLPATVTIATGSSTATIPVTPIDDPAYESNETVILTLSANAAYGLGSPATGTVTIVSNDLPPDLVVTTLSVPAVAGADVDIVVTDTTRNQGTGQSPASTTGFYLSTNGTLEPTDIWLGSRPVPALAAGATNVVSTTLHIPPDVATGAYRVLAQADWQSAVSEGVETNNVTWSSLFNLGPDLIVYSLTAPASAAAGQTINVSVTTKNQGGSAAAASTTRFYWSTNSGVDPSDPLIGSLSVPVVAAGASSSANATLTVPTTAAAGTLYYVVAQADGAGDVPEPVETNNTRASGAIQVGADLVVTAVSAPASAAAGATISVTDTTKNQGAGTAAASATGFYLSTDSTPTADEFIGSRPVGELASNGTATASTMLQIPVGTLPGTYYVIAKADWNNSVGESTETNNNRASGAIGIGGDLVVTAITAPATAAPGSTMTVSDTTKNQGAGAAAASATGFYLSADSNPTPDEFIGSRPVGELASNGTATASTTLQIPVSIAPGTYYVIAKADWNNSVAESTETNNTRTSGGIRIGGDLVVTAVTIPSAGSPNGPFAVNDTTMNQGAVVVPQSVTGFYLSVNTTYEAATDVFLGSRVVASLGPSVSSAASTPLVVPAGTATGSYYVIAVADMNSAVVESVENNNVRASGVMRVGPDLIVQSFSVSAPGVAGATIGLTATTKNQGGEAAPASVTHFYLSTNSTLDAGDPLVATRPVASLGAGLSDTGTVSFVIPPTTPPGSYYIIVKSDGTDAIVESLENNNTQFGWFPISAAPPQ